MTEILKKIVAWHTAGTAFALARVVSTWGSAPRRPGSIMLISHDLRIEGSVSGGCIEGSVMESAQAVLKSGVSKLLEFGVDNETAWSVGLSCGGRIEVLVESWESVVESAAGIELLVAFQSEKPCVFVTALGRAFGHHDIYVPDSVTDPAVDDDRFPGPAALRSVLTSRQTSVLTENEQRYFLHVFAPRRRMIVVGGSDITTHLLSLARVLDFETTVIDPRGVFTQAERFATPPDHLYNEWPQDIMVDLTLDEDTYAVLLTHDPKIDDPALHLLLEHPVAYIGALGGRKTQEKRRQRMADAGFNQDQIDRIHGPVGLDINAASPAEIALSILAQVIAVKNRKPDAQA